MNGRKKSAAPGAVPGTEDLSGDQHDEAGKVFIGTTDSIVDPRSDAGTAESGEAGKREHLCRRVIELIGVKRADEAEFVSYGLQVGHQVGNLDTGLATAFEGELIGLRRSHQGRSTANKCELFALEHVLGAELMLGISFFNPSAPIPPKARGRRGFKRAGHLDSEILRNAHGKHGISRRNSSDGFPSTASYVSHPWPSVFVRKSNTELVP